MNDTLENSKFLITDLLAGDENVLERSDFEKLTYEDISKTIKSITSDPGISEKEKLYILTNLWRINFREKPPSIEEFLTPKWIGPTGLSIYPHIKETLSKFWSPDSYYRHLLLAPAIGWGKSTASALSILYTLVHINLMRKPKAFWGIAEATPIVAVLGSFTIAKSKQVLLAPFFEILETSPKFRRVLKQERVRLVQEEEINDNSNRIVWTRASKIEGAVELSNDLHIVLTSSIGALLGMSIVTGALSELSFFLEEGVSPDEINRMYNDLKGRIRSRFGERYYTSTIIDSSPNTFDSPIDKYVFSGEAEQNPRNLVIRSTHWDVYKTLKPEDYAEWIRTGETFPVYRGSAGKPPLLLGPEQVSSYPTDEIFNVPIDLLSYFKDDTNKAVKDYCGWPANSDAKLIGDFSIIDKMFSKQLKNIYQYIKVPADKPPERLIWDQIVNDFFVKIDSGTYEFYRAPREKRFISIDLAESGDMASISCVHPELNIKGEIIVVGDFTISIIPGKERINLSAVESFIYDLKRYGHFHFEKITYDQFQSSQQRQDLERQGLEVERFSVDIETGPYYMFISLLKNERIKVGRNIFLRNNLKSLHEVTTTTEKKVRKKVDHTKGRIIYDDGANWNSSYMGINAKDVSDSLCAASNQCINYCTNSYIPKYQWIDVDESSFEEQSDSKFKTSDAVKEAILKDIYEKYSLKLA